METDFNLVCFGPNILQQNNTTENYSVTKIDLLFFIISILVRPISIFLNIILALEYYNSGNFNYFLWTICVCICPIIVTTTLHYFMHYEDKKNNKNLIHHKWYNILLHIIILPFFFRYCHAFYYALASRKAERKGNKLDQKRYFENMLQTDSDIALLRIFECFLEIAPQKTLQIAIMLPFTNITKYQILSLGSLIISLTWCMASYQRCIRFTRTDKNTVTIKGTVGYIFWQSFIIVGRILSLAIVASIFPVWTLLAGFVHILLMTIWLFFIDRSPFCETNLFFSFLFSFFLGIVYVYNYILPKEGRTLYRYIFFYIIMGLENFACIIISIYFIDENNFIPYFIISLIIVVTFIMGLLFMCSYYKFCHPNVTNN